MTQNLTPACVPGQDGTNFNKIKYQLILLPILLPIFDIWLKITRKSRKLNCNEDVKYIQHYDIKDDITSTIWIEVSNGEKNTFNGMV